MSCCNPLSHGPCHRVLLVDHVDLFYSILDFLGTQVLVKTFVARVCLQWYLHFQNVWWQQKIKRKHPRLILPSLCYWKRKQVRTELSLELQFGLSYKMVENWSEFCPNVKKLSIHFRTWSQSPPYQFSYERMAFEFYPFQHIYSNATANFELSNVPFQKFPASWSKLSSLSLSSFNQLELDFRTLPFTLPFLERLQLKGIICRTSKKNCTIELKTLKQLIILSNEFNNNHVKAFNSFSSMKQPIELLRVLSDALILNDIPGANYTIRGLQDASFYFPNLESLQVDDVLIKLLLETNAPESSS